LGNDANEGKARRKPVHYAISQLVSWFLFTLIFGFRCLGRNRIPRQGGCIIACSHQSFLDPIIVGFSCSRAVNYLARSTLFKNRLFAALIRSYGAMELERDEADVKALKRCVERLRRGEIVLLFPEGTRTRTGEIAPLKPGVFLMSSRAGVPVVPAAIEGSLRSWPRGRIFPRPAPLRIAYGEPVYPGSGGSAYRDMAVRLRRTMQELQARIRRIG
jgi:1-acyl-sn-glycerol-3-phosphate acyltransferase